MKKIRDERKKGTSNAIVVRATSDSTSENRERVRQAVGKRDERHADADC